MRTAQRRVCPHCGVGTGLLIGLLLASMIGASAPAVAVAQSVQPAPTAPASRSPGCGRQPSVQPGATADAAIATDPAIAAGASSRRYRVHLPAAYVPDSAYPLVLVFHGYGGNAADMESMTGFSALADAAQFIAVYPQGLTDTSGVTFWASTEGAVDRGIDEVRFTNNLLDALEANFCIDTTHIDATGFSNGGAMVGLLACQLSDRIAAFAPVSGNFYAPQNGCSPGRPLPILEIHGTADQTVPYNGAPAGFDSPLPLHPIPTWLQGWAARDACMNEPVTSPSDAGVTMMQWVGCAGDGTVIHYRIDGGGHDRPPTLRGRSVAAVLWDFFQAYPHPANSVPQIFTPRRLGG
jgi:polyhydroxybutyrate depolymerase